MISTNMLNLFPVKGGVSQHYSPKMIMSQQSLDYEKHCQAPFGAHVQANQDNDPTNMNLARTIDAIYLQPNVNVTQGGHELMNLSTGEVIT